MKSKILRAVHDTVTDLHDAGAIPTTTLRRFDKLCLPPLKVLGPEEIRHLRETFHLSQAVFAAYLNTSLSTIQKWEIGAKRPNNIALKMLNLVKDKGINVLI